MNFRKSVLSAVVLLLIGTSTISASNYHSELSPTRTIENEVLKVVQKLNIDFAKLDQTTINLKFMVNQKNELVVLGTNDSPLDASLKGALNYKEIDAKGLVPYKVYILPIRLQSED